MKKCSWDLWTDGLESAMIGVIAHEWVDEIEWMPVYPVHVSDWKKAEVHSDEINCYSFSTVLLGIEYIIQSLNMTIVFDVVVSLVLNQTKPL